MSVRIYKRKGGKYHVLVSSMVGGKRREKTVASHSSKREAERIARAVRLVSQEKRAGVHVLDPLVTSVLAEYVAGLEGMASHESVAARVRIYLAPALQGVTMSELTTGHVRRILDDVATIRSKQTVVHVRAALSAAINRARSRGDWDGGNVAAGLKTARPDMPVYDWLRPHEIRPVIAQVAPQWRNLFGAAVHTGMRRGELFGLQKRDVFLDESMIVVRRSHERDRTKSGRERRVPVSVACRPFLVDALKKSSSILVFPNSTGGMHPRESRLCARLRSALIKAGLVESWTLVCRRCGHREPSATPVEKKHCGMLLWRTAHPRKIRFHDLRHTTMSLLAVAGVPLSLAARIIGDTEEVARTRYQHFDFAQLLEASNLAAAYLDDVHGNAEQENAKRDEEAKPVRNRKTRGPQ